MSLPLAHFDAETHTYTVGGIVVPAVNDVLKGIAYVPSPFWDEISRARGKAIHRTLELFDRGRLKRPCPYEEHVLRWEAFKQNFGLTIVEIETPVFSNTLCGTPDRVAVRRAKRCIVEIKTGQPATWHTLQLAGYCDLCGCTEGYLFYADLDGPGSAQHCGPAAIAVALRVFKAAQHVHGWRMRP